MRRPLLAALTLALLAGAATALPAMAQDGSAPEITVQDPGERPRVALRYVLTPGTTQESVLKVNSRVGQRIGDGDPQVGSTPQIELDVTSTIGEPTQDAVVVEFSIDDGRVEGSDPSGVAEDAIEDLIGLRMTITMTTRGQVLSAEADIPAGTDDDVAQLLDQFTQQAQSFTVPLPEDEVGEGARWRARTEATISGIDFVQTTRYELTRLSDESAELSIELTQRAPRQTFEDPSSGVEVELLSSKGTGSGSSTLSFDLPFPIEADIHTQVRQKLRGQGQRLTQTITQNAFIDPA